MTITKLLSWFASRQV